MKLTFEVDDQRRTVSGLIIGSPTVEFSAREVSQATIDLNDVDLRLLRDGLVNIRSAARLNDWKFEVAGVETLAEGRVKVTLRSAGVQTLKNLDSSAVEADVDPSDYVKRRAETAALALVAQPAASRAQIGQTRAQGDEEPPNEWDVINDIAGQLGYFAFEAAGTLYFGKPSWLIDNAGKTWVVKYNSSLGIHRDSELHPVTFPTCRRTADNDDTPVTADFTLPASEVEQIKPGDKIKVEGIPTFDAEYLVVRVTADINGVLDGSVSAETPIDPEPRPPGNDSSTGEGGAYALAAGALGFDFGDFSDYGKLEPYAPPPGPSAIIEGGLGVKQGQGFSWPCAGRISGIFGEQRSTHRHAGIDIAAPEGRPVFAARSGFVSFAGSSGAYGNLVKIVHGGNYETRYAHLSLILKKKGDRVEAGMQIGLVGSTGRSTGPHLHWEVRRDGVALNPRNFTATPSPEVLGPGTFSGPVPLDPVTPPVSAAPSPFGDDGRGRIP